jgi:hypothetical protein
MRFAIWKGCLGTLLVCASTFCAQSPHRMNNGSVTDVGPEAGLVWGISEPFLFRGRNEILITSARAGIYKKSDGGQTWARMEPGLITGSGVEPLTRGLCQSALAPDIAYVVTEADGVSRTTDFGESWEPLTVPIGSPYLEGCAIDPTDPSILYVLGQSETFLSSVFKSTDGGRTFSAILGGSTIPQWGSLAVAPTNPMTIYIVDQGFGIPSGAVAVSSDGGLNFRLLTGVPQFPIKVYPHPTDDGTLLLQATQGCSCRRTRVLLSHR